MNVGREFCYVSTLYNKKNFRNLPKDKVNLNFFFSGMSPNMSGFGIYWAEESGESVVEDCKKESKRQST